MMIIPNQEFSVKEMGEKEKLPRFVELVPEIVAFLIFVWSHVSACMSSILDQSISINSGWSVNEHVFQGLVYTGVSGGCFYELWIFETISCLLYQHKIKKKKNFMVIVYPYFWAKLILKLISSLL